MSELILEILLKISLLWATSGLIVFCLRLIINEKFDAKIINMSHKELFRLTFYTFGPIGIAVWFFTIKLFEGKE